MLVAVKQVDEVFCSSCGQVIKKEAEICVHCGVRQKGQKSSQSQNSGKITAGLLAILVGGLGAHKFYLGQIGMGILYLIFCWTFVPSIIALIEGIIYLTKSDEEFYEKYGK